MPGAMVKITGGMEDILIGSTVAVTAGHGVSYGGHSDDWSHSGHGSWNNDLSGHGSDWAHSGHDDWVAVDHNSRHGRHNSYGDIYVSGHDSPAVVYSVPSSYGRGMSHAANHMSRPVHASVHSSALSSHGGLNHGVGHRVREHVPRVLASHGSD